MSIWIASWRSLDGLSGARVHKGGSDCTGSHSIRCAHWCCCGGHNIPTVIGSRTTEGRRDSGEQGCTWRQLPRGDSAIVDIVDAGDVVGLAGGSVTDCVVDSGDFGDDGDQTR